MKKFFVTLLSLLIICPLAFGEVSSDTTTAAPTSGQETAARQPSFGERILNEIGGAINNATTTTVISGKYALDPLLNPLQINVSTQDGVVTLKGNVDSNTQYARAVALASATNDVKSVNAKELTVTPSVSPMSDTFTTLKVKLLLIKNSTFKGEDYSAWDIHVETNNNVVFLVGTVKTDEARNQVLNAVSSVSGVNRVVADLVVVQNEVNHS